MKKNSDKMTVFISWSGEKSKKIAMILKQYLSRAFLKKVNFWVSDSDISAGRIGIDAIIDSLDNSDLIITVLERSNYNRSWIYFENGMVFSRKHKQENILGTEEVPFLFPIIFDDLSINSFEQTPFINFQLLQYNKESLLKLVKAVDKQNQICLGTSLGDDVLDIQFEMIWKDLDDSIRKVIQQKTTEGTNGINTQNIQETLSKYISSDNISMGEIIKWNSGFETQEFYKFLVENVKHRLYIFGRKNRKLTDRGFEDSFTRLFSENVDVKMLYLDPYSEDANKGSVQDISNFAHALKSSINLMYDRLKIKGIDISKYCKIYDCVRDSEIIIADDVIMFKDLGYDDFGRPIHFTNQSFDVTAVNSLIGNLYYKKFESAWDKSMAITEDLCKKIKTELK